MKGKHGNGMEINRADRKWEWKDRECEGKERERRGRVREMFR